MGVAVGDIIGLKQYKENNMANLPVPSSQPPSVKLLQKLLEEQRKTNQKLDILIELQTTNGKTLKNINIWMAGRIVIALFFLVIAFWVFYQTMVSIFS